MIKEKEQLMLDMLKSKAMSAGMALMQSPAVGKMMESEKVGVVLEKAMTLPFKISGAIDEHKEKLVALLDLATQQDLDELRRGLNRIEDVLENAKKADNSDDDKPVKE